MVRVNRELIRQNENIAETTIEKDPRGYAFVRGLITDIQDPNQLTVQSLSILLAAIDSVATLLSATFFLLAQDDRVVRKLRASILESIGYGPPTYEQLRTLKYMRHVLNEGGGLSYYNHN